MITFKKIFLALFSVLFILLAWTIWRFYFEKSSSGNVQETKTFHSSVNDISFKYPNCLGETILDVSPGVYGEYIKFSEPEGCDASLSVSGISLGREGIDRGGIFGVPEIPIIFRGQYLSKEGKNFTIITGKLPDYQDRYKLAAFYTKDEGKDEMSALIVMMYVSGARDDSSLLGNDELEGAKKFVQSIMETIIIR